MGSYERWSLVDEGERPDLIARLAAGEDLAPACALCGSSLVSLPVDVLRETESIPLLLCFSADAAPGQLSAAGAEMLAGVEPGPTVINLPFEAAPVVLGRSQDADLTRRAQSVAEVGRRFGSPVADSYDAFLSAIEDGRGDAAVESLVGELGAIETADEFAEFVARKPEALADDLCTFIDRLRIPDLEGAGRSLDLIENLLRHARRDPRTAWERYQQCIAETKRMTPNLEESIGRLEQLAADGRRDEVIRLARTALAEARAAGIIVIEADLRRELGKALLGAPGDRGDYVEEAVEQLDVASSLTPAGELRADALINLAVAYGRRVAGDPEDNLEAAIGALSGALTQLDERAHGETCATAHTNLARSYRTRERERRSENLEQARFHAEAALRLRDPVSNTEAWAYSQTNYGDVLAALADAGEGEPAAAIAAFERVTAEHRRIPTASIVANAHFAIGAILRRQAGEHWEAGREDESRACLERAAPEFDAALAILDRDSQPVLRGRALSDAALVRDGLSDRASAKMLLEEAVDLLCPDTSPRDGRDAARRLGDLLAAEGNWTEAAAAYRQALAAAQLTFHARHYVHGRQAELRGSRNLARFAAYAIARAGEALEAVLVLEDGRARELRRRTGAADADLALLVETAPDLHAEYAAALREVAGDPLGGDSEPNSRRLSDVLAAVRRVPGLEGFAFGARLEDIHRAIEPDWPIVYVNPAPQGTVILTVALGERDEVCVHMRLLDEPDSQEVFLTLMAGDYRAVVASGFKPGSGPPSLLAIAADSNVGEVADALDYLLPWLGERLAAPVAASLRTLGAQGATLVPCGPLGLAPLHACPWVEGSGPTCLLDSFDVRYAPSALIHSACLARAAKRESYPKRLVGLANPTDDLDAAEPEVEEIARTFGMSRSITRSRSGADSTFLRAEAAGASHLHLACHGESDVLNSSRSVLHLADGELALAELAAVDQLQARLAVLSACQTATPELLDFPDEVFSVGTALIAAGSACAIGSMWSVDDAATALLMTRMYEELLGQPLLRPPEALRRAALWLRGLNEDEETAYLSAHPALEAEFVRRRRTGDPPGRRGGRAGTRPYAHADLWAPFIAVGA